MEAVIDMIEEFEDKYEKCTNIKNEIIKLTTELDQIENNKINKIQLITSFLLFIPLLSYILLIYMNNPTGGNTLSEMFISNRVIPESIYYGMSETMYIVSFIYAISTFLKIFICNKLISKNVKNDVNYATEIDVIRFGNIFLCFLVSFMMSIGETNHDLVSITFLLFMTFSMSEVLMHFYLIKKNKDKKIEKYNRVTLVERFNKIEELEKEFEKENEFKDNLKNEILKNPLLMKKVIMSIDIDKLKNDKEDYRHYLIKELKTESEKKEKQQTEMEIINIAYKNIYNKDIENNFEIENS